MGLYGFLVKRTGAKVPFKKERITNAIYRAAVAVGGRDRSIADDLADQVVAMLEEKMPPDHIPTIEEIQDVVEKILIENGRAKTAKAYILYRDERARQRKKRAERSQRAYENMEPESAALALAELAYLDQEAVVQLLISWQPRTSGAILDALTQADPMLAASLSYEIWRQGGKKEAAAASDSP